MCIKQSSINMNVEFVIIPVLFFLTQLFLDAVLGNASYGNSEIHQGMLFDKSGSSNASEDVLDSSTTEKPSFDFLLTQFEVINSGKNSSHAFYNWTDKISLHLKKIINVELGVERLQHTFDSLSYEKTEDQDKALLFQMVESLDNKISAYAKLIINMTDTVRESYSRFKKQIEKQQAAQNLMFDYLGESNYNIDEDKRQQPQYYPCCIIPDNFLSYDPLFGKRVNTELWCDSGLDQNQLNKPYSYSDVFYAPLKLTEMFALNHRMYPSLKWQFFMSSDGIHTEFPAHRSGTSVNSECGKSSRHHDVYEATVRPLGRNILLLFDLGYKLTPRLLLTAKGIGHYVVNTLIDKDRVAVLGASNTLNIPKASCMKNSLMPATLNIKQSLRKFIDYMEVQEDPTNHTLAFERALEILKMSFSKKHSKVPQQSVLIMYVTRGLVENKEETRDALKVLSSWVDTINANIVISAYGLDISHEERPFLEALAYQQYDKYNIKTEGVPHAGAVLRMSPTLRLAPILQNFYEVAQKTCHLPANSSDYIFAINKNITISEPYWDSEGNGMVLTLSKEIYTNEGDLAGVVGIDLSLDHLLEGATYFNSPNDGYIMVIDEKENVLAHPRLGRPESWKSPLLPVSANLVEDSDFSQLQSLVSSHSHGDKKIKSTKRKESREYLWKRSRHLGWVYVVLRNSSSLNFRALSRKVPSLSTDALFHRLDLLTPQEAKVCRYFNQMATLDEASIFLSPGAFQSPSNFIARSHRNVNIFGNIMAYLKDEKKLLSNPGLKDRVREEASALQSISSYWKSSHLNSNLDKYIIRRYGATKSGVTVMYPGTLLDANYDPTSQQWFLDAINSPDKVIVSYPFLDPGGAGHAVTISHTVYQGKRLENHSSSDHISAVLAADFTLGYFHKLIADMEPACAHNIYYKGSSTDSELAIRCFLVDTSGYLLVHPSYILPSALPQNSISNFPSHLTHQEPVLSMSLLGKGLGGHSNQNPRGFSPTADLKKYWCARWWQGSSERLYSFQLEVGQMLSSLTNNFKVKQSDHTCLQYILTPIKNSNLILGIVNQTCSPPAFCPCSTSRVNRHCLNCQLMEASSCECPCKCALPSQPCSHSAPPKLPIMYSWHSNFNNESKFENSHHSSRRLSRGHKNPSEAYRSIRENQRVLTCPREPEPPGLLPHDIAMLSQWINCVPTDCSAYTTVSSCMGVKECIWCQLESDGFTFLTEPFCIRMTLCYDGVKGGPSPYPPGLSSLPHSKERSSNLPIGAVAGGVLAVFLVMAFSLYCYRTYVGDTSTRATYTPTSLHNQVHHSPLYPREPENSHDELLGDGIISASAAATISPYRMNPGYRRPVGHGEASDHGYSTMTPHDESENLTSTDLAGASSLFPASSSMLEDERGSSAHWSDHSEPIEHINPSFGPEEYNPNVPFQTQLSSPRRIGPNKLIVPVTVHMVDTV